MFLNKDTIYSAYIAGGDMSYYESSMINNKKFYDVIGIEFEGSLFWGPKNWDEVLTNSFGDYMSPPPINEQKPKHGFIKILIDENHKMN